MNDTPNLPARVLRSGSNPLAIVPTTIEDAWRIAKYVALGKMAPESLMKNRNVEELTGAVTTIILSGMELGLPPMVSLRSFGLIGNKPGLYGDGLINVCRRHQTAEYVKLGFTPGYIVKKRHVIPDDPKSPIEEYRVEETFADNAFGWCEAKRSDTGEVAREEFTVADAKRAGLWDDREFRRGKVWENGQQVWSDKVPNDTTWHRYPKRMLQWRAAGYNLRNLFADVLGGMPTVDELQEIEQIEDMRDITPPRPTAPVMFPDIPDEEEGEPLHNSDQQEGGKNEVEGGEPFDLDAFLTEIDEAMATATDDESGIEVWDSFDVEATLTGDEDALERAFTIRNRHLKRLEAGPDPLEDPDVPQESKDAINNLGAG